MEVARRWRSNADYFAQGTRAAVSTSLLQMMKSRLLTIIIGNRSEYLSSSIRCFVQYNVNGAVEADAIGNLINRAA